MNAVHFKYKDQAFTLDLDAGELQGTVTPAKKEIEDALEQAKGGYLGAGYLPIPPTDITDPYHHASQFALCLLFAQGITFPPELKPYIPHWPEEESAKPDFPGLEGGALQEAIRGWKRLRKMTCY